MSVGSCPSCGAPVEFRPGAGKVRVCEHCHAVVLRGDAKLETVGKVADLVDTESPLKLRLSGRASGTPFTIVGRIQKANATGTWDEWCLELEDGRTAWLAESEGEWKLLFPIEAAQLPDVKTLQPLSAFTLRDRTFVVEEVSSATTVSAEGQLPEFNREHRYVDATGPKGVFCTLDAAADGTPLATEAFVGSFVTLDQLGFDKSELAPTPRRDALSAARCSNCNGPLELKAPDATRRVACPYCGALLDCSHGKLEFLKLLEKPPYEPVIPLGAVGKLNDPTETGGDAQRPTEWTCIAFLIRSCNVEGTRYPWEEYLLWNRDKGFRWLMQSNLHWTWLRPIPAGEVQLQFRTARYGSESFRGYQSVYVTTDYVAGECYWTVSVGELAQASEFVEPPRSINVDQTINEATCTLGLLLEPAVVQQAFNLKTKLNTPYDLAPAQPNPYRAKASEAWTWTGIWGAALLGLIIVFSAMGTTDTYYQGTFSVAPDDTSASPTSQRFSEPFEVKTSVPLEVTVRADGLSNNWLGVSVDLVNEETGEVIAVYAEPSYYSGTEGGESWSEGSREQSKQTADVDKGRYVMRVTPSFDPGRATDYTVTVKADDGPGACCPITLFLFLLVVPLYFTLRSSNFETRRWNDAVFQSAPGVSTFPYAKSDDE